MRCFGLSGDLFQDEHEDKDDGETDSDSDSTAAESYSRILGNYIGDQNRIQNTVSIRVKMTTCICITEKCSGKLKLVDG